jgi:hypothetical protein
MSPESWTPDVMNFSSDPEGIDPMTELGALIRMVEQVRAALPNAQPPAELAELSWDVILDEMRALRRNQRGLYGEGGR